MKIIINADDFGYSHEVNLAIVEAFQKGFITNTTIMTNMPGFEEAIELSKKYGFFDKVGIHLNFFEGIPLTKKIKNIPLFMQDNQMTSYNILHKAPLWKRVYLSKNIRIALKEEAYAQLLLYKNAGFSQYHLDSHGHSHTIPSIYFSIIKTINEFKFRTVRKSLNLFLSRSPAVCVYKYIINFFLNKNHTTTKYFSSANEFIDVVKEGLTNKSSTCEIMVHPVYKNGKLVNNGGTDFEELLNYCNKFDMISYSEI